MRRKRLQISCEQDRVRPTSVLAPDARELLIHFVIKLGCHRLLRRRPNAVVLDRDLMDMGVHRYDFALEVCLSLGRSSEQQRHEPYPSS